MSTHTYSNYRSDLNKTLKHQAKVLGGSYQVSKELGANMERSEKNRTILVQSVLPMVEQLARYYDSVSPSRVEFEDLLAAGNMGAVRAADVWLITPIAERIKKNAKFSTMARHWILKYIKEEINERKTLLSHGSTKSYEAAECYVASGDMQVGKDGEKKNTLFDILMHDNVIDEGDNDIKCQIAESSAKLFDGLSNIERRVLFAHFGIDCDEPKSMDEIGSLMGKNKSWAYQIVNDALGKLKCNAEEFDEAEVDILRDADLTVAENWKMQF